MKLINFYKNKQTKKYKAWKSSIGKYNSTLKKSHENHWLKIKMRIPKEVNYGCSREKYPNTYCQFHLMSNYSSKMDEKNCRLCLKLETDLLNIFSDDGAKKNIPKILMQHFWFEVKEDDSYSKKICSGCWEQVESFHIFYTQVHDSHNLLYSDIQDFIKTEVLEGIEGIKNELESEEKTQVASNSKNSNKSDDAISETIENDAEISANDRDFSDSGDEYNETNDSIVSDSSDDDCKRSPTKSKKRLRKSTSSRITRSSKAKVEKTPEELAQIEKEDQQLREYFKMDCDLCSFQFFVFQNVKTHYRVAHQLNGYLTCCDKKFFKRWHALEHIRRHLNPDAFKCDICDKIYIDKRGLQTHMYQHLPLAEKPFKCQKCPKAFAKNSLLRQHQIRHITEEEKSFFCEECGKAFASNCLLQFHKRGVHEGAFVHVCEICAKSFKSKLFFENHMKAIHSDVVLPKVQCQTCGAWLKHEHSLKSHMRRHDDANKTYLCNICGKQAPNRGALLSHKKYAHLIERSHKCTICDKAFKKPVTLREHMTLHTGEILYKCPHCPKTFNSSANLHSHRKKVHTTEWEQTRRTKIINYNEKVSTYL